MRVLFFGTHPKQFNGYSKVVYELMKCSNVFKEHDIEFSVFGFQKFFENPAHRRDLPVDVPVYDAHANENPKQQGFGFTEVRKVVNEVKPDVCIIYNDMMVLHNVITQIKLAQNEDGLKCKIIAYIDQVYLNQKKEFIDFINKNVDHAILFTPYWEKIIKDQGLALNTDFLRHGFNPMTYFPVPKHLSRRFFNLKETDFIVMNLNRNQPRKRWDICLKAWAEFVSRHKGENVKLLVATAVQGAWNLIEIYERELKKRDMTLEMGMQHIVFIENPQQITDEETNILYNVADIGINTCDGEGFGLCNFEQAAIGIPQIVPRLGGFIDFFDENSAMLVDPVMGYYVDNTRDAVCGEALLCDYGDFVEALESLYSDADLRARTASAARKKILTDYKWEDIATSLANIVNKVTGRSDIKKEIDNIKDEIEKIDISSLNVKTPIPVVEDEDTAAPVTPQEKSEAVDKTQQMSDRKKKRKLELAELKKKLDLLLADDDSDDS
jgi:glycosyltransferase involved in cell wall biosynthesis